jgi:hypothetical protein
VTCIKNVRFRDSSVACLWRPLEGGVSCSKSRPAINVPILPECRRVLKLASLEHRPSLPWRVIYKAGGAAASVLYVFAHFIVETIPTIFYAPGIRAGLCAKEAKFDSSPNALWRHANMTEGSKGRQSYPFDPISSTTNSWC